MGSVNTLIKWPGGKAEEIGHILDLIPEFDRYIEPFFGGGAMFFHLRPDCAVLNDVSKDLMDFYGLVKAQDTALRRYLTDYCDLTEGLAGACDAAAEEIHALYRSVKSGEVGAEARCAALVGELFAALPPAAAEDLVSDAAAFRAQLRASALDKMRRTVKNDAKSPFSEEDLRENLVTGFISGSYLYFRDVYNGFLTGRTPVTDDAYRIANFYFIREYCYGAMFRYNRQGEFNIPYGGMSYNRKNFRGKVQEIFNPATEALFSGAALHCLDFEDFFRTVPLTERDFMFLDPPYDSDFSDYEGNSFSQMDHIRLAETLSKTKAQFILIIKNTDFIASLYTDAAISRSFDKAYTYNVRSRNERKTKHLIITYIPEQK